MNISSLKLAAFAVVLSASTASAQGALQAVPRDSVSFNAIATVRATVVSGDTETHTIAFATSNGRLP